MKHKREVRKRARRIAKIRRERIQNEIDEKVESLMKKISNDFDNSKISETEDGFRYQFEDDYIDAQRYYDGGQAGGYFIYQIYIGQDKLHASHEKCSKFFNFLSEKFKDSKTDRINKFFEKVL